jgi:hypothetical protein
MAQGKQRTVVCGCVWVCGDGGGGGGGGGVDGLIA